VQQGVLLTFILLSAYTTISDVKQWVPLTWCRFGSDIGTLSVPERYDRMPELTNAKAARHRAGNLQTIVF
jgi:hypothetical protein